MICESACGKVILFGEHAVVYGRPALAVPLANLRARASIAARSERGILLRARDVGREYLLSEAAEEDALALITRLTLDLLGEHGNLEIAVESDIPVASGFGSGAAISVAIARALAAYFGEPLTGAQLAALAYETEKLHHGTPSGIDNTVIAFEQAVRFVRGKEITPFHIACPFPLVIANTGIPSLTKITVGEVRRAWENDRARYEGIFDRIGMIVEKAQEALAQGDNAQLGELMRRNQRELTAMGVSSPEIERLIDAATRAGAAGGKLSGGGRGGNVIVYPGNADPDRIRDALSDAGAASVIGTTVGAETP